MKRFILWIVVAVTLAAMPALAAIPLTMNYQGVLTDGSGAIVPDGTHNFNFSIFNVPAGGSALWGPETHSGIMVTRGGFSVVLGSVTPLTLPFDQQYYLEIAVDGGSPLSPRVTLASSPYSLAPWTTSGPDITRASGNVGIGTANPSVPLQVGGPSVRGVLAIEGKQGGVGAPTMQLRDLASGGNTWNLYSGAPAIGDFSIFTPGVGTRMTITNSGNVGFGTETPSELLQVGGSSVRGVVHIAASAPNGPVVVLNDLRAGGNKWNLYSGSPAVGYFGILDVNASRTRMTITNGGNVGFGTETPGAALHLVGGDAAITTQGNGIILKATNGSNCFRVTVDNAGVLQTTAVTCP